MMKIGSYKNGYELELGYRVPIAIKAADKNVNLTSAFKAKVCILGNYERFDGEFFINLKDTEAWDEFQALREEMAYRFFDMTMTAEVLGVRLIGRVAVAGPREISLSFGEAYSEHLVALRRRGVIMERAFQYYSTQEVFKDIRALETL